MQVGVLEPEGQAAFAAITAGIGEAGPLAQEQLSDPEREALLSDSGGAVEEKGGGETVGAKRPSDSRARLLVPLDRVEGHSLPALGLSHRMGSSGCCWVPPPTGARIWNSRRGPSGVA